MPQETKSHDNQTPDGASAQDRASLEGHAAEASDREAFLRAIDEAFDYRGDVTLTLDDGEEITGYIFDRRAERTMEDSVVRMLVPGSDEYVITPYARIAKIAFTGKDTAHGKTFERWVERFIEKRMAGESASIEGEGGG